jgi:hypothetical protein
MLGFNGYRFSVFVNLIQSIFALFAMKNGSQLVAHFGFMFPAVPAPAAVIPGVAQIPLFVFGNEVDPK